MSLSPQAVPKDAESLPNVKPGGYLWEFFTPQISPFYADQYSCSICYLVLRDPFKCQNNHLYCKSCIYSWITSENRCSLICPVCRDEGPFIEDSKIRTELDNHVVSCVSPKCFWTGKLADYQNHAHGKDEAEERHVPDITTSLEAERLRKESGDGFMNEDRIVTMMSVIYADIEQRRRRIENIRMGRNYYTNEQLGDIQMIHERLLSLRNNIDMFFDQSDSSPLWTRFSNVTNRPESNSSVSSGGLSETELSDEHQAVEPIQISHSDESEEQIQFFGNQSFSLSSEFDYSEDSNTRDEATSIQALVGEFMFDSPEETVQTSREPLENESPTPVVSIPSQETEVPLASRPNSTAASRLRYDYLSRRFNFQSGRRRSDVTDIKRRKMN